MNAVRIATIINSGSALDGTGINKVDGKIFLENGIELTIEQLKTFNEQGWLQLENNPVAAPKMPAPEPEQPSFLNENINFSPNQSPESLQLIGPEIMLEKEEKNNNKTDEKPKNKILSILVSFIASLILLGCGFGAGYYYAQATQSPKAPENTATAPESNEIQENTNTVQPGPDSDAPGEITPNTPGTDPALNNVIPPNEDVNLQDNSTTPLNATVPTATP